VLFGNPESSPEPLRHDLELSNMARSLRLTVIDVIEQTLERPLDPSLIVDAGELGLADIERLAAAYVQFADAFPVPQAPVGELWPLHSWTLRPGDYRDPESAEASLQLALGQLVYAHGLFVEDYLGRILARTLEPKYEGGNKPRWLYRHDDPQRLTNYLEVLAYLRPLIDSGLVVLLPRVSRRLPGGVSGYVTFDTDGRPIQATPWSVEAVMGRSALTIWTRTQSMSSLPASRTGGSLQVSQAEYRQIETLELGFTGVITKLDALDRGYPGCLSLESPSEKQAFDWMLKRLEVSLSGLSSEHRILTVANELALPRLVDLQPSDVIALHQSDLWGEYRAALRQGVSFLEAHDLEGAAARRVMEDELAGVARAAESTTKHSSFLSRRREGLTTLGVGAVVAAGAAPIVGVEKAATELALASMHAAAATVVSWLHGRRTGDSLQRCFGMFY
jgi:hypothetical protein